MATDKKDAKIIEEAVGSFEISRDWRAQNVDDKNRNAYKMYRSFRGTKATGRSNLHIPKFFEGVEVIASLLHAAAFPRRPYANFTAKSQGTGPAAEMTTRFIDYQINDKRSRTLLELYSYIQNMPLYGTSFGKTGWKKQVKTVRTWQQTPMHLRLLGHPARTEVSIPQAIIDGPTFERIPIMDAYPHPNERPGLSERLPFTHRKVVRLSDLQGLTLPVYKNLELVAKTGVFNETSQRVETPRQAFGEGDARPNPNEHKVELLEHWFDEGQRVVVIANRQVVIRDQTNPYFHAQMPILSTPYVPDPEGGVYGIGIYEPNESLYFELNDVRNQRMDNVNLALNSPFLADIDRLDDPDNVIFSPENLIGTDGPPRDVIERLRVDDFTRSAQDEELVIKADIQSSTGVTDFAKGVGSSEGVGNETSSGLAQLLEQLSKRLGAPLRHFEDTCFIPLLEQFSHLDHQFLSEEDFPFEGQIMTVDHMHFKESFDIETTGSVAHISKTVRFQQLAGLVRDFQGHPNVNQVPLIKELLEMGDIKNIDEIIIEQPEEKREDPKVIFNIKDEFTASQKAQLLQQYNITTSPEDLFNEEMDELNDSVTTEAKRENSIRTLVKSNNEPIDRTTQEAKRNANPSGR